MTPQEIEDKLFNVIDTQGENNLYFADVESKEMKESVERDIEKVYDENPDDADEILYEKGIFRVCAQNEVIV